MGTINNTAALIKAAREVIKWVEPRDFGCNQYICDLQAAIEAIEQQPTSVMGTIDENGLKPCPFCRTAADIEFDPGVDEDKRWYSVGCWDVDCEAHLLCEGYRDKDEAINRWNMLASLGTAERLLAGIDVEEVARDISTAIEEIGGEYTAGYVDAEDELRVAQAAIASIKRQLDKQGVK